MTGAELRSIRLRAGLTQEELARKLSVTLRTVQRMEQRERISPVVAAGVRQLIRPATPHS